MFASLGGGVLVTFLRLEPSEGPPSHPAAYATDRSRDGNSVVSAIRGRLRG
jgi:hypothetical protein